LSAPKLVAFLTVVLHTLFEHDEKANKSLIYLKYKSLWQENNR
jgi:hypothetical protein